MSIKSILVDVTTTSGLHKLLPVFNNPAVEYIAANPVAAKYLKQHGVKSISTIDNWGTEDLPELVISNLNDIEQDIAKLGSNLSSIVSGADKNRVNLIRVAACNFSSVVILVNPSDYEEFSTIDQPSTKQRVRYAQKAFAYVSKYDNILSQFLFMQVATGKL